MKTFEVEVSATIKVTLDESKFDEAFMEEFRQSFFPFYDIEEHAKHLAQLSVRGILYEDFIEGYGPAKDMGIVVGEADVFDIDIINDTNTADFA